MRHGRGALLSLAKRLLRLAHLGALPVAHSQGDAFHRGSQARQGHEITSVTVARHDLRRYHLGPQAQRAKGARLDFRTEIGVGADRARDLAHSDLVACLDQRPPRSADFAEKAGEDQASRDGLGVDAVRAANHRRFAMLVCPACERRAQLVNARQDFVGGFAQNHGE